MARTATERKAAERARLKEAKLVRLELHVPPEDVEPLKEAARKLAAARSIRAKRR